LRYLKPLGKRTAGHTAMSLQQEKRREQPVGFQSFDLALLIFLF
jgi:hypothetical protein